MRARFILCVWIDGCRQNQCDLSIKPSSIGVRQLGQFMFSVGWAARAGLPSRAACCCWGDHEIRTCGPQRDRPFHDACEVSCRARSWK